MTRSSFPAIPSEVTFAVLNRPAALRTQGPFPVSLTKHDPLFTAAMMSALRSCILPTEHIAMPDREPPQDRRVNRQEFVMFGHWKPNRYSRYDPPRGRIIVGEPKKFAKTSEQLFFPLTDSS